MPRSTGLPWVDALDQGFVWTEDMSPAEREVMLKYGPDTLAAARGGAQVGGGPASLVMTQRPIEGPVGGVIDRLAALASILGTPLASARAPMPAIQAAARAETPASFVSPGARRLLNFLGWSSGETARAPIGFAGGVRPMLPKLLKRPAAQLPMPLARAQSVGGDLNAPQVVLEMLETPSGRQHYMNLLNRTLTPRGSPLAQDPLQAGAYEVLLSELLRGSLP